MLLLSAHCLVTLVSSGHCSCPALPSSCGIAMSKVYELLGIRTVLPFSLSELLCTICSSERGTNESLQRGPLNMVTCWLHSQLFTTARCGEDVLVFHSVACSPEQLVEFRTSSAVTVSPEELSSLDQKPRG